MVTYCVVMIIVVIFNECRRPVSCLCHNFEDDVDHHHDYRYHH